MMPISTSDVSAAIGFLLPGIHVDCDNWQLA